MAVHGDSHTGVVGVVADCLCDGRLGEVFDPVVLDPTGSRARSADGTLSVARRLIVEGDASPRLAATLARTTVSISLAHSGWLAFSPKVLLLPELSHLGSYLKRRCRASVELRVRFWWSDM